MQKMDDNKENFLLYKKYNIKIILFLFLIIAFFFNNTNAHISKI